MRPTSKYSEAGKELDLYMDTILDVSEEEFFFLVIYKASLLLTEIDKHIHSLSASEGQELEKCT